MPQRLKLQGGKVYDPANQVDGLVQDILIEDGRIVSRFAQDDQISTLNVEGMIVMPGGVDMHCHMAGPAVNRARRLLPEFVQNQHDGLLASTRLTGQRYAALGYTTAIEAAISASAARQTHFELHDTPNLDKGFLLLLGNHEQVLETLAARDTSRLEAIVSALLHCTGAFGIKIVNPGAVSAWQRHGGNPLEVESIDDPLGSSSVTSRSILTSLAEIADNLKLPHPVHVHANRLGVPGNINITLQTLQALQGRRHHLTHVQFHAYGSDEGTITSAAEPLMDYLNAHPESTCDIGQVMFGNVVTLTEDSPLEYLLWQLTGKRWVNLDSELESGCGMLPFEFKDKVTLHAWQWAIGLELLLLARNPWQVVLSTDHPNGASFLAYPSIMALLMDAGYRHEAFKRLPAIVQERSLLRHLNREYSLQEIAIITRAAPARILGLKNKGHLAPGADADVTVYINHANREQMFRSPRLVIKGGNIVVQEGYFKQEVPGCTFSCSAPNAKDGTQLLKQWFSEKGSYAFEQFGVSPRHREQLIQITH